MDDWRRTGVVAAVAVLAATARADSPKGNVTSPSTSGAEVQAAKRRAQLAAPVVSAASALSAITKSSDTRPRAEWKQLISRPGAFGVSFPGTPTEHSITSDADSELGSGVSYELVLAPDQAYVAGSTEIRDPKSNVDAALADALQGAAEQLHGTLKNVVHQVSGSPEIQGRITLHNGAIVVVQFLLVDHRMYGVAAGDRSGDGLADVERFLASFAPTVRPTSIDHAAAPPHEYAQLTAEVADDYSSLPAAAIDFGKPTVTGSLEVVVVTRYLKRNTEKLRYCYQKELQAKPRIAGALTLDISIAADGAVSSSHAGGIDPTVASCFADVVGGIEFPKTAAGGTVKEVIRLRPAARR